MVGVFFSSLREGSRQRMEVSLTTWPNGSDCEKSLLHHCNTCERSTIADGRWMHPLTIQSGSLTGLGSPPPPHKGGRWEAGRRVSCRAWQACTIPGEGHSVLPARWGQLVYPTKLRTIGITLLARRRRGGGAKVQIQDVVVCRSSLFFPGARALPNGLLY